MLLSNARKYLNMSETEPNITVQAKWHFQIYRHT